MKVKETKLKSNQAPTQPKKVEPIILLDEYEKGKNAFLDAPNLTEKQRKQLGHASYIEKTPDFVRSTTKGLTILKGYTTSQINQALKADNPYPARVFLKVENQEQDIPIFFRIKESNNWVRPKIKTGSLIQVEGYFAVNKEYFPNCKMRKSFTAYSYQLLNQELNQQIESHVQS